MRLADTLVLVTMILGAAVLIYAVIAPMFDTQTLSEREHLDELRHISQEQQRGWDEWADDWNTRGGVFEHHTYPELFPDALDAEAERLARTADIPRVEPRLVPLPEAGTIEPTAVLAPGEIAGWVAEALSQPFEADSTFVRLLVTAPLDEIPGLFSRPLALTAGGQP